MAKNTKAANKKAAHVKGEVRATKKTAEKVLKDEAAIQENMGSSTMTTRQKLADLKVKQDALRAESKALREAAKAEKKATTGSRKTLTTGRKAMKANWATMRSQAATFTRMLKNEATTGSQLEDHAEAMAETTALFLAEVNKVAKAQAVILNAAQGVTSEAEEDDGLGDID